MKNALWKNCATIILFGLSLQTPAITFTGDATLAPEDKRFDGEPIVVSNCVLTVDGPHTLASLQLLDGAVLTHTHAPAGFLQGQLLITNESHSLHLTNSTALLSTGIVTSSIVVRNPENNSIYTVDIDYTVTSDTNDLVSLQLTSGSSIPQGGSVMVDYIVMGLVIPTGLNLNVSGDAWVSGGARINVDGKGFAGGQGPGAGRSAPGYSLPVCGSGAGHGGFGGTSATDAVAGSGYGSALEPITKGSGGGSGGAGLGGSGGGVIRIAVEGMLRLDGSVSARGGSGLTIRSGGGSGGSIWLKAGLLVGSGTISTTGGDGEPVEGGGGGGGRIALYANQMALNGSIQARGGAGYAHGGPGSIYSKVRESRGELRFDNGGNLGSSPLLSFGSFDLVVREGSHVAWPVNGGVANLLIESNAWLSVSNRVAILASNLTIHAGGGIRADGYGYNAGQGPGAGKTESVLGTYIGGGGGNGGNGGSGLAYYSTTTGGSGYGSFATPAEPGSGGGDAYSSLERFGSRGGGAFRLSVPGMLLCDGLISASGSDAADPAAGGGAGGSISMDIGSLAGSGRIAATGGNGDGSGMYRGGGGGGGRISISSKLNLFFGSISVRGGDGYVIGGAGTIYTKTQGESYGTLLADNEGWIGASTFLSISGYNPGSLVLRRGATAELPFSQLQGLAVQTGSLLTLSSNRLTMVSVAGDVAVEAGGAISLDGRYAQARGAGPGGTLGDFAGGGGYGGKGGSPLTGKQSIGGASYGEPFNAGQTGSAGGHTSGGAGGGVLSLRVANRLLVDGIISADGEASRNSLSGGGGSGGGISLESSLITGSGMISCDGGKGSLKGGGGGGGRIALTFSTNLFRGNLLARGGEGNTSGGAGTISLSSRLSVYKDLIVDNGGRVGSDTPLPQFVAGKVFIRNGAKISQRGERQTCSDLELTSNAWIVASSQSFSVSNLFVDATSGFNLDGGGSSSPSGPGSGESNPTGAGGAGHGGRGGAGAGSTGKIPGGSSYGDASNPTQVGSAGGSGGGGAGGIGGGMLGVVVSGKMILNGTITASATAGSTNSGGGSGGSINLSAGAISGTGAVIADGGNGGQNGGGGGGGRISVQSEINVFQGLYSAKGGSGYVAGGAGTLYLKQKPAGKGVLVFDNGGQVGGALSVWGGYGTSDLVLSNGAAVLVSSPATLGNLTVGPGGTIVLSNTTPAAAMITVTGNVRVAKGGAISMDEKGYASGQGPGTGGGSSGGGGFGGFGGSGAATSTQKNNPGGRTYGSVTIANEVGSGGAGYTLYPTQSGGIGGAGGGGVRLLTYGNLLLEGTISANGGNGMGTVAGGGSGGGIFLSAKSITGNGLISANGGNGTLEGGGGGGGRIVMSSDQDTFTGRVTAYGGTGFTTGGAGTIYRSQKYAQPGTVYVDNGGRLGTNTSIQGMSYSDVHVANGGILALVSYQPTIADLVLASNGWIWTTQIVFKAESLTIAEGAGVLADGGGFAGGQGPGVGAVLQTQSGVISGGGGYGGFGGVGALLTDSSAAAGGIAYGSTTAPSEPGSGGGGAQNLGGSGGGVFNISLTGALVNNGVISANGAPGARPGGGGGAGGTIRIQCSSFTGAGVIRADGGKGNGVGGPGGGGRVAIIALQDSFTGRINAFGGIGQSSIGGAGTICRQSSNSSFARVLVDNNGRFGTNTLLSTVSGPYDLTIRNGAIAHSTGSSLQLSNLLVGANGTLTFQRLGNPNLTVQGNAVIEPDGRVTVDGLGYSINQGPGAGRSTNSAGSGGGHGGRGGASAYEAGGLAYGSLDQPVLWGSGGGSGLGYPTLTGSQGGGAIRFFVGGTLVLNGQLSANGNDAVQDDAGGGSGGSVLLLAHTFLGNGSVTAHGGTGNLNKGGGGGGGRIAVYAPVNVFAGTIAALGGSGFEPGQNGSVFFSDAQWPRIEGRVLNTQNQPVPNLPLQANAAGLCISALTAPDGTYSLSIPPLSSPTVCPADATIKAAPAFRTYEALTATVLGQDYLVVPVTEVPALAPQLEAGQFALNWAGTPGVTYHVDSSTNLVDWTVYETEITCSTPNQPMHITLPRSGPHQFFRLRAEY